MLGATAGYHVPHRFTEGYGIQQAGLEKAVRDGYQLVVSVDCGIRAHEPLHWARANGLDIIITDHHLPDEDEGSPPALSVLNPNQHGCHYPDKNLAGVGVAFKLIHALFRERGREAQAPGFLKMVAIGTVADACDGNNSADNVAPDMARPCRASRLANIPLALAKRLPTVPSGQPS